MKIFTTPRVFFILLGTALVSFFANADQDPRCHVDPKTTYTCCPASWSPGGEYCNPASGPDDPY